MSTGQRIRGVVITALLGIALVVLGSGIAQAEPTTEEELKVLACMYISPLEKMTPDQAEEGLVENGASRSHAHQLVQAAIASGCQTAGMS